MDDASSLIGITTEAVRARTVFSPSFYLRRGAAQERPTVVGSCTGREASGGSVTYVLRVYHCGQ
jgi:hypothetical protein